MNTAATLTKFEMTVDLNVLEHLGINLYSIRRRLRKPCQPGRRPSTCDPCRSESRLDRDHDDGISCPWRN